MSIAVATDSQAEADRLEEVAALISATERRAMAAERDTVDRLIAAYLAERINDTFDARISGVTKAGLFVQLPQYGADGFIPVSSLGGDYYIYDETARSLFGERTGKGYQLADRVEGGGTGIGPPASSRGLVRDRASGQINRPCEGRASCRMGERWTRQHPAPRTGRRR